MGSDSIVNGSITALAAKDGRDFGKKKRTNKMAKLKQCKLDARREQWLSQVLDRRGINAAKNKGCKEESNGGGGTPPSSMNLTNEQKGPIENPQTRSREEETDGSSLHDSDLDSVVNSPGSSVMGANDSRKDRPGSSCGSSSSISSSSSSISSSSGCYSGNFSEEDEEDGCLDDWEAVADALTADDKERDQNLEPPAVQEEPHVEPRVAPEIPNKEDEVRGPKPECKSTNTVPRAAPKSRAWRADDAFRPQSLPNLSKQYSFPMNAERQCTRGSNPWMRHSIISQPSSCPICYEDLDLTDSSFCPCSCGFRLCLFCHKKILEADARCPGCRKPYEPLNGDAGVAGGALPFCLSRSCSMNTRA